MCYATDESGKYSAEQSRGWDVKIQALDVTWDEVKKKVETARQKVLNNEVSPLLFFMERSVMDVAILASYAGLFKWQVKRHLKPTVFNKLSDKRLHKYAEIFNVTVEELKSMNVHEQ